MFSTDECPGCDGNGLINFTDEEWIQRYGVPLSQYQFTGKEEETMKRCPSCNGTGRVPKVELLPKDYEACGECGFDHSYEPYEASIAHMELAFFGITYDQRIVVENKK